jgi:integrase
VAPSFFLCLSGARLHPSNTDKAFARLTGQAGLQPRLTRSGPCLKSLRHSFAVNTLVDWYRSGVDTDARLPLLSTWLGHVAPSSTYWYLDADLISAFLHYLEVERGNSVRTRKARLAAIRCLFRHAAWQAPEHAATIQRVLAICGKRIPEP